MGYRNLDTGDDLSFEALLGPGPGLEPDFEHWNPVISIQYGFIYTVVGILPCCIYLSESWNLTYYEMVCVYDKITHPTLQVTLICGLGLSTHTIIGGRSDRGNFSRLYRQNHWVVPDMDSRRSNREGRDTREVSLGQDSAMLSSAPWGAFVVCGGGVSCWWIGI